jgi:hypothetical protein
LDSLLSYREELGPFDKNEIPVMPDEFENEKNI